MYSIECTFDPKALFLLENVLLKPMESFVVFQFPRCRENFAKLSVQKVVKAKASRRYVAVSFFQASVLLCVVYLTSNS